MKHPQRILYSAALVCGIAGCANSATTPKEVEGLRSDVKLQLSSTDAILLLERINDLENRVNPAAKWLDPAVSFPAVVAVLGWVVVVWQYIGGRKEREAKFVLDSLKWFEGKTQRRSIGIAVAESNWTKYPQLQVQWTAVLAGQAIHLLTRTKERESVPERYNLVRIMSVLRRPDVKFQIDEAGRDLLKSALAQYTAGTAGLIGLSKEVSEWQKDFS